MSAVDHEPEAVERGLARVAQKLAGWTEKWFPDAYIFAAVGVVLVAVLAMINGASPVAVAQSFGGGFWDLTAFTLQMAMVVLTGYVVATSPPVAKLIEWLARRPNGPRSAIAFVALLACLVSMLNWGLSLVFGGLLARAIARRKDLAVDYRALGAAAFMGLGSVWALGLSSSAAQLQATASSIPESLLQITGVLDFGKTIFTWQSLLSAAVLIVITVIIAAFSAPRGAAIRTAEQMQVDLNDEPEPAGKPTRPGERPEYSPILPWLLGLLTLGWLINEFVSKPFLTVASSLNGYLLVFLMLGLVLHGTPRRFLDAVAKAVPATAGILIQFPLYAAMGAVLTEAEGFNGTTVSHRVSEIFTALGGGGWFAVVLVIYTAAGAARTVRWWQVAGRGAVRDAVGHRHRHEPRLDGADLQHGRGPAEHDQPVLHVADAGPVAPACPRHRRLHRAAVHAPPAGDHPALLGSGHDLHLRTTGDSLIAALAPGPVSSRDG